MDDLSDFQPFEGATNRTAIVTFQKGRATNCPVPYLYWRKKPKASINLDDDLDTVLAKIEAKRRQAQPINPAEPQNPWLTARPKALTAVPKAVGQSACRAYEGSNTGGLSGAYWLEITGKNQNNEIIIRNLHDEGKIEVATIQAAIEPEFISPLLRGREGTPLANRW